MQHRLHKVLSSYTFSSAALDQLGGEQLGDGREEDEEESWQQRRRQQQQQQRPGSSSRHGSTGSLGVERAPP